MPQRRISPSSPEKHPAQRRMKPKKFDFIKLPRNLFKHEAFLDFSNVIGRNGSNYDSETGHFVGITTLQKY